MLKEMEVADNADKTPEEQFEFCIGELIKAKEKMTASAVISNDPEKIKSALMRLLESNKTLISALDVAYKKLHEARLNITSRA